MLERFFSLRHSKDAFDHINIPSLPLLTGSNDIGRTPKAHFIIGVFSCLSRCNYQVPKESDQSKEFA